MTLVYDSCCPCDYYTVYNMLPIRCTSITSNILSQIIYMQQGGGIYLPCHTLPPSPTKSNSSAFAWRLLPLHTRIPPSLPFFRSWPTHVLSYSSSNVLRIFVFVCCDLSFNAISLERRVCWTLCSESDRQRLLYRGRLRERRLWRCRLFASSIQTAKRYVRMHAY